jgi:predicted nucleotidyltransferase
MGELFANQVLSSLLAVFMMNPDEEFHQRRLSRIIGRSRRPVQVNLKRLEELNIVESRPDGNRIAYKANRSSSIFEDLRNFVVKTTGLGIFLKEELAAYSDRIPVAFIYGSVAEGKDDAQSDLDLLIVGDISIRDLSETVARLKERLRRELNIVTFSPEEIRKKYRQGNHFVRKISEAKKIFLIGSDEEFRSILG